MENLWGLISFFDVADDLYDICEGEGVRLPFSVLSSNPHWMPLFPLPFEVYFSITIPYHKPGEKEYYENPFGGEVCPQKNARGFFILGGEADSH